ncbi:DUF4192 family protein [Streptomyces wuyuanensis]|uniref:DUF4192 domain-containing protein n=1 Tax=Streptomyces wuyuanensis TaxID=1196353 RepID=UPI003F540B0B
MFLHVRRPFGVCAQVGSANRQFWSYCCPDARCCPAEGTAMAIPGTSVMAAAAAYAGIQVRGSLREMESRLEPLRSPSMAEQERALDSAGAALLPRILHGGSREQVGAETLRLARRLMKRLGERATLDTSRSSADARDDRLISHAEAAAVILGLQDRDTRDRAAAWMEGRDAHRALRLWRALARRCAGPYAEHAAAPLSLAGWVSWSTGDEPSARVALSLALRVDPEYVFARLLHQACNDGLDPEDLRRCLRTPGAALEPARSGTSVPGPVAGASVVGPVGSGSAVAELTAGSAGYAPAAPDLAARGAGGEHAAAEPAPAPAVHQAAAADTSSPAPSEPAVAAAEVPETGKGTSVPKASPGAAREPGPRSPGPAQPPCHRGEGAARGPRSGSGPVRPAARRKNTAPRVAAPGATPSTGRRSSGDDGDAAARRRVRSAGRPGGRGRGTGDGA